MEFANGLPVVRGDRVELQQVVINLVKNGSNPRGRLSGLNPGPVSCTPRHTSFGSVWLVVMSTSRVPSVTALIAWTALRTRSPSAPRNARRFMSNPRLRRRNRNDKNEHFGRGLEWTSGTGHCAARPMSQMGQKLP